MTFPLLNRDEQINTFSPLPLGGAKGTILFVHHSTSPERAFSSILYSTVTLTLDLLNPNCEVFISVLSCIADVWSKCVKYSARYRVNNVSRRTHAWTGQYHYVSGHTTLGGGIKIPENLSDKTVLTTAETAGLWRQLIQWLLLRTSCFLLCCSTNLESYSYCY